MTVARLQNARRASAAGLLASVGRGYVYDADAEAFIASVEAADGQRLEYSYRLAVASFVAGCKSDGIWSAIAVCYVLCGARTLAGALKALKGSDPTNSGPFVSGDYTRGGLTPGLKGNGSTKFLNTGRADNTDGQNDNHRAVYVTQANTALFAQYVGARNSNATSMTEMFQYSTGSFADLYRNRTNNGVSIEGRHAPGFKGMSRSASASFNSKCMGLTRSLTDTSVAGTTNPIHVLACSGTTSSRGDGRVAFFSAGAALDLDKLEVRVLALVSSTADLV